MGYNTDWLGEIKLNRDLTPQEQKEWNTIIENRHDSEYHYGDERREFPSIWCGFEVDGNVFRWDGAEKTYEGIGWIKFFLNKVKEWNKEGKLLYAEGDIEWRGEGEDDMGRVLVEYLPFGEGQKLHRQKMHIENGEINYNRKHTLHI